MEQVAIVNPSIRVLGQYSNTHECIEVECKICGHVWYPQAGNLMGGSGCPRCAGHKRLTQNEFLERLKKLYPNITTDEEYINSNTFMRFKCITCGSEFSAKPSSLWTGSGCRICSSRKIKEEKGIIRMQKLSARRPFIEILSDYCGANSSISCLCKKCNYQWTDTYTHLMDKLGGCPKCAHKTKYLREHFFDEISNSLPDVVLLGKYITSHDRIKCKCNTCGYEWMAYPYKLLQGFGCPVCTNQKKKVGKYDGDKLIKVYDSVSDAAKEMKVTKNAIWNCCKGKTKKSCGYSWKYVD